MDFMTVITMGSLLTFVIGFAMMLTPSQDLLGRQGARLWGLAMVVHACGWLVSGTLRAGIPPSVNIMLGSGLLMVSLVMCLQVIARSRSVHVHIWRYYVVLAICIGGLAPLIWLFPDNNAIRIIPTSAFASVVYARVAALVLLTARPAPSEIFTGTVFMVCAIALLARMLVHIEPALGNSPSLPLDNQVNVVTYLAMSLAGILMTFGYLLMGHDQDIRHLREIEHRMRHLAQHDALTDLPNRALFTDRLQRALANARRDNQRMALMFLDINRFKAINDTLGHAAGDIYLQALAQRLRSSVREQDTVARIGGDEFVILLPLVHRANDAHTVAGKILASLQAPVTVDNRQLAFHVSIGIACYPDDGITNEALQLAADRAMYAAKSAGDNQVRPEADTRAGL